MSIGSGQFVAWSYGVAGALYLVFAVLVGMTRKRGVRAHVLLACSTATAIWGIATAAYAIVGFPPLLSLGMVADVLCYAGWFVFLLLLGGRPDGSESARFEVRSPYFAAAVGLVAWGLAVQVMAALGFDVFGDPARMAVFVTLAAAILGLVLVEQVFRTVDEESRWAVTPLCLGLAGLFAFDVYTFAEALLFNVPDPNVWSARGIVRAVALPLVVLSVVRTHGGRTRIVLSRQLVFRSTALAICGVYLLLMAGAGYYVRYFGGEWGPALQVAFLFAALLLLVTLTFSGSIRAKLRVTVSKHFFRYRYDYRQEWLRFTQVLSVHDEHVHVGQQVIKGLADMVESPGGGLWLRDATAQRFIPAARWNLGVSIEEGEPFSGELASFLDDRGWVVNLEEYRSSPERYGELRLPVWLSSIDNAWLVVPLVIGSEVTGFVVLLTARTPLDVNWEVNDLLKTAGRQAAIFLGQVHATEALLEARKFDAFNRMSAFVVHDLKNIVAQLSLMLRNAERHRHNPEFQQDMLMTVEHSVERMKQLMLQLRDGTTPLATSHRVDLAEIASRVQRAKAGQQPRVDLDVAERVVVRGHEDRLERVLGHLVQNAIDASTAQGRVWIRVGRVADDAVVEVGDTGHGMTQEFIRERLFKPFQTTKETGMGIGAYESHQYVREVGGRIDVDSTVDVGTRVRLTLPIASSDSQLSDVMQKSMA